MPATKDSTRRLCILYATIRKTPFINKLDIQRTLLDKTGIDICVSSIEKDMFSLREDFDVKLKYSRLHKGYYIIYPNDKEFVSNLFMFLNLTNIPIINEWIFNKDDDTYPH
jgi:hypothetical protein